MLAGSAVLGPLRAHGVELATGVPCSHLGRVIAAAIEEPAVRWLVATGEGEAVAIAAGTWLAGGSPVVLAQNSGLGNMVNPLASLAQPCRIPFPVLLSWRAQPGTSDEPQHELTGRATEPLLDALELEHARLPDGEDAAAAAIAAAWESMRRRELPYVLLAPRGLLDGPTPPEPDLPPRPRGALVEVDGPARLARLAALELVIAAAGEDAALVATTGKTGRELHALGDRPQHFYNVGAMGCASAIALGVALRARRRVVVLDGDGAALMRLGALATIGAAAPPNLLHVLLDNGVHDSTGGQRTDAATTDFARVALACGYRAAVSCSEPRDVEAALADPLPGPRLVHVRIRPGSLEPLARPALHPSEVARRFREFVTGARAPAAPG